MRRSRLHVVGASGAGTTTLARALAEHWAVPHADVDDYFWVPSTPPFRDKRPETERVELMRTVFVPREAWVLSGSMVGWGESVVAECEAVVFLTLDPVERLRRLETREKTRRAGRDVSRRRPPDRLRTTTLRATEGSARRTASSRRSPRRRAVGAPASAACAGGHATWRLWRPGPMTSREK